MRINRSEEFVIGGYTRGERTFDVIVIGRWDGDRLVYVARTRVGFSPASRERLMDRMRPQEVRSATVTLVRLHSGMDTISGARANFQTGDARD